jgi:ribosome biogenesis GTPase A
VTHYEAASVRTKVLALALNQDRAKETRSRIAELCKRLAPHRNSRSKNVRVMVVGIPNGGKSTLINLLMERKVAKVGDEPAVTKVPQFVRLENGMTLLDNAGILWPRMDEAATLRLALGGAIPDAAIDYEIVALFAAEFLLLRYPAELCERFKFAEVPASASDVLTEIGRKHAGLRRGGSVDLHKASDVLLHEFRAGKLGRISLEAPGDAHQQELASELGAETLPEPVGPSASQME